MGLLFRACTLVCVLFAACASTAYGHALGESYVVLQIEETRLSGNVEINERELASQFGISLESSWTQSSQEVLLDYLSKNFQVQVDDSELALQYATPEVLSLPQGKFLQLGFDAQWPSGMPTTLLITQRLFFEADSRQRSLLLVERNDVTGATYDWERTALVFSPHNITQELNLRELPGLSGRLDFLVQGAWHILIGYDHILFLLTLLLTAVMVRGQGRWLPETSFRKSLWKVAGIVTVFTVAHSITLSLAALGWVSLPSWFIESVIALSIVIVALHNLRPFLPNQWLVIFFFGLFHGLGFAGVMEHLSFRMTDLLSVLVMFNIGVELGQLAIVCTAFPILYAVRNKSWYVPVVIYGGSTVIAVVATVWLLQRLMGA